MDLKEELDNLMGAFNNIKEEVRRKHPNLYEQWKAGGFLVDNNVASMYPSVEEVVESLPDEDHDEDEDDDSED